MTVEHSTESDAGLMEPWGPFSMGGFEGCTDQNPDHCACATDAQPTCRICGQEIERDEQAWARQWPCYDTLPLAHADQEWEVISWHDECPDARFTPPAVLASIGGRHPADCYENGCVCDLRGPAAIAPTTSVTPPAKPEVT